MTLHPCPTRLEPARTHLERLQIFHLQCVELNRGADDVHRAQLPDRALARTAPSEHALHLHVAGVGLQRHVVQELGLPERARQLGRAAARVHSSDGT